MQPAPPALLELALRLRQLRMDHWPDRKLTQSALAKVLGGDEPLSPATVASWENRAAPKLPPRERMLAYAQFFATARSVAAAPRLLPVDSFSQEERASYETLRDELLRLHAAARGTPPIITVARAVIPTIRIGKASSGTKTVEMRVRRSRSHSVSSLR